ncbi:MULTISPECIES: hypothetical protein [unclassified Streptomyces]|uniref:hypothetical protein n=1 Tax=unclassified Streptomyces TaxID=2593676 RepID=UPI0036634551
MTELRIDQWIKKPESAEQLLDHLGEHLVAYPSGSDIPSDRVGGQFIALNPSARTISLRQYDTGEIRQFDWHATDFRITDLIEAPFAELSLGSVRRFEWYSGDNGREVGQPITLVGSDPLCQCPADLSSKCQRRGQTRRSTVREICQPGLNGPCQLRNSTDLLDESADKPPGQRHETAGQSDAGRQIKPEPTTLVGTVDLVKPDVVTLWVRDARYNDGGWWAELQAEDAARHALRTVNLTSDRT